MRFYTPTALAAGALVALMAMPASAAMTSRIGDPQLCELMATISHQAALMRVDGLSQQQAADRLSAVIGSILSDGSGSQRERQRLADLVGQEATGILRLVYSVPIGRTTKAKTAYVLGAQEYVFGYCMGYHD